MQLVTLADVAKWIKKNMMQFYQAWYEPINEISTVSYFYVYMLYRQFLNMPFGFEDVL